VIESDVITRHLFEPDSEINQEVRLAFGERVVALDGSIDRATLGEIVFKDPALRQKLNELVHPAIRRRQKEFLDSVAADDPRGIGIVEAALIIEMGNHMHYDKIVLVSCRPEVQRRRLRERSSLTDEQIEARIASQMSIEEKLKFADFVIDNSNDLGSTRQQVQDVYRRLRALA
jgi:dephospho-CoA kinase